MSGDPILHGPEKAMHVALEHRSNDFEEVLIGDFEVRSSDGLDRLVRILETFRAAFVDAGRTAHNGLVGGSSPSRPTSFSMLHGNDYGNDTSDSPLVPVLFYHPPMPRDSYHGDSTHFALGRRVMHMRQDERIAVRCDRCGKSRVYNWESLRHYRPDCPIAWLEEMLQPSCYDLVTGTPTDCVRVVALLEGEAEDIGCSEEG